MKNNKKIYFIIVVIILITMPIALTSSNKLQLSDLLTYKKGNPKFDSQLNDMINDSSNPKFLKEYIKNDENENTYSVKVIIDLKEFRPEYMDILKNNGAEIQITDKNLIQVIISVNKLEAIANLPFVDNVQKPIKYEVSVISEGINTINATKLHDIGYNGSGVKIGIADLGFQDYESKLGTELPLNIIKKSFSEKGIESGEKHGTAVAEIIHDIAPGAQLFLTNFETDLEYNQSVAWLISQNVSIISASVGKDIGPKDGTDYDDKVVDSAVNSGIFWVNSAGNNAETHWTGNFNDPDNDKFLNFNGKDELNRIYVLEDRYIKISLDWNDWPKSDQDYDLYLLDNDDQIVSSSTAVQNGTQKPYEIIIYKPKYTGFYYIGIKKYNATEDVKFHLYMHGNQYNPNVEYTVSSGSIVIPTTDSAFMVGATNWSNNILEHYSSQGPTDDGRIKPDIVGPSRVTNSVYGRFAGTSASAPHVAAAGALLLSKDPNLNNIQLKNNLEYGSKDLGIPGKDNKFGSGIIDVYKSANLSSNISIKGDANKDGKITSSDALLYLRYSVGQDISPYNITELDDVTCDNRITSGDALKVLRKAVGQDISLICV